MSDGLRLGILDYGTFEVHEDGRRIPILGYVITAEESSHSCGHGLPRRLRRRHGRRGAQGRARAFGRIVALSVDNRPAAQLARAGCRFEDVTDLVITHGDIDHVGGLHEFPGANLVVSRAELRAGPPRYFGDVSPVEWPSQSTASRRRRRGAPPWRRSALDPRPLAWAHVAPRASGSDRRRRPGGRRDLQAGGADEQSERRRERRGGCSSECCTPRRVEREGALLISGHDPDPAPPLRYVPDWYV